MATSDALGLHRRSVGMKPTGSMSVVAEVLNFCLLLGMISSSPKVVVRAGKKSIKNVGSGMMAPLSLAGSTVGAHGSPRTVVTILK